MPSNVNDGIKGVDGFCFFVLLFLCTFILLVLLLFLLFNMVESFLLSILITVNFFGVFDVCVGVFVLVVSLLGFDMIGGSGKEHLRLAFLLELPVKTF